MKYILILAVVIVVIRIEFFIGLVEKAANKAQPAPVEVDATDISSDRETIPLSKDPSFKSTPRKAFFAYLEDFQTTPVATVRENALELLKKNPQLFGPKLDTELEAQIFRWRDHLINNDQETMAFLRELLNVLQGENQQMVRRFFSLLMDINMENFIAAYSKTKDTNCSIATTVGDPLPEEEIRNEMFERDASLKQYLAQEKIEPVHKAFATNCLLVLGLEIAKYPPPPATEEAPVAPDESLTPGVTP